MALERSELFDYYDGAKHRSVAWLRVYHCHGWYCVVATDRSTTYECRSVTNSIEELAAAAVVRFGLLAERVVWIEHYDYEPQLHKTRRHFWKRDETFDLVKFERIEDGRFHRAGWTRITRERAEQWTGEEIVAETESGVTR